MYMQNHNHENEILRLANLWVFGIANSFTNQRTNGPVNAHLKPEIYTNKLV